MNIYSLLLCGFLLMVSTFTVTGNELQNGSFSPTIERTQNTHQEQTQRSRLLAFMGQDKAPKRLSFASQSGFLLLRKEEIILLNVNMKEGGLFIYFRKKGKEQTQRSLMTLSKAAALLNSFPFLKVNRSTIINFNEVEEYEGTRRNGYLLMSNGEKVKLSRTISGEVHDYIKSLGV